MSEHHAQSGRETAADPARHEGRREAADVDLHGALAALAGIVAGAQRVEDVLARIAGCAARAIPAADEAGVTLLRASGDRPEIHTCGATGDLVREIDRIQHELLGEGPCIDCMQALRPVVSGSLGSDGRWPRFGDRVARLGVHSVVSLPLVIEGTVIGSVNVYARQREAFADHAVRVGNRFAGPAAVAVHNARMLTAARSEAEQLQSVLRARAIVDQAIGLVRGRSGGSTDEALVRLRQIGQREGLPLAAVAQRLVDEAVRTARARRTGR